MAKNQFQFFATAPDLGSVLSAIERDNLLQYTLTGMFESPCLVTYPSYSDIPGFGRATHPTAVGNAAYLILPRDTEVRVRAIPQKAGGMLFGVDQIQNEDSVVIRLGGRYGEQVLLCGMIGTVSSTLAPRHLLNLFARAMRKAFVKVDGFFVGPEAMELSQSGVRLTDGNSSPFSLKT